MTDGIEGLFGLAARLRALGYDVAEAETARGVPALLVDRDERRAAILPVALHARVLRRTVESLRALSVGRGLRVLGWGQPPRDVRRGGLRRAGIELALYEPLDASALRFQLNRALAHEVTPRGAERAPTGEEVCIRSGLRRRSARLYTLSARGAYLATEAPLRPGRRLTLEVPLDEEGAPRRTRARVVLANRPDDGSPHPALPPGMAVCFQAPDEATARAIEAFVTRRLSGLLV